LTRQVTIHRSATARPQGFAIHGEKNRPDDRLSLGPVLPVNGRYLCPPYDKWWLPDPSSDKAEQIPIWREWKRPPARPSAAVDLDSLRLSGPFEH
jgi:hypothetical protein